jgi:hypothetical protein
MPTTDEEAHRISWRATQLRSGTEYRHAGRLVRGATVDQLRNVRPQTELYAAARLQIGTWDQIAKSAKNLTDPQKREFFKAQPAAHMWQRLEPAVTRIRRDELGADYAKDFEDLAADSLGPDRAFATADAQAICALFC